MELGLLVSALGCGHEQAKGFTLIELLVVIAIIALLVAILMPAMSRVKRQARSAACQSNMHQWSLFFSMYTQDYEGSFPQDVSGVRGGGNPALAGSAGQ